MKELAANLVRIEERITQAAIRVGRQRKDITLVAVSKHQPLEAIQAAQVAGLTQLGENYVQEALSKQVSLPPGQQDQIHWHLIGHLQRNKVKQAVGFFALIQSVDSISLAQSIARQAALSGLTQAILLQVHLGSEETKTGFASEAVLDAAAELSYLPGLDVQGLMGIAPFAVESRPYFAALHTLFARLAPGQQRILSMGMTGDFEAAIEEGATMVRIGTALFGSRIEKDTTIKWEARGHNESEC